MKNRKLSTPLTDPKPWPTPEDAYLHFLNDPEGFADQLRVKSPKVRWAIAGLSNQAWLNIGNAGDALKLARQRAKELGGVVEHRSAREDSRSRAERQALREDAAWPVYLSQLSGSFQVLISTPAPEDISVVRELPQLLKRALKLLDSVVPEVERVRVRAKARVCPVFGCHKVFLISAPRDTYCPTCLDAYPSPQRRWWRTLSKEQRQAHKHNWTARETPGPKGS